MDYKSNTIVAFNDNDGEVYFIVDIKELLGVTINTPGIPTILRRAFEFSKNPIPVDSGLMKSSYTMKMVNNNQIKCFFDRHKIIGKKRYGRVVEDYYPQYLVTHNSRRTWLQIVLEAFYSSLNTSLKQMEKKNGSKVNKNGSKVNKSATIIDYAKFLVFYIAFQKLVKKRKEEDKKRQQERAKRLKEIQTKRTNRKELK